MPRTRVPGTDRDRLAVGCRLAAASFSSCWSSSATVDQHHRRRERWRTPSHLSLPAMARTGVAVMIRRETNKMAPSTRRGTPSGQARSQRNALRGPHETSRLAHGGQRLVQRVFARHDLQETGRGQEGQSEPNRDPGRFTPMAAPDQVPAEDGERRPVGRTGPGPTRRPSRSATHGRRGR